WGERFTPRAPLTLVHDFFLYGFTYANYWVTAFSSLVALVLLLMLIRVKPPATLMIYTVIVLALALFSIPLGLRPRFVLTAFPLCMAAGIVLRRWLLWGTVVCGSVAVWYVLTLTVTGRSLVP
ncbi:MAG: hypothetical protein J2P57_12615, partial [Acidimicrobiaceae bacterium]|nr:hypothetical protein [Acidimicrobiaceae bacterium]